MYEAHSFLRLRGTALFVVFSKRWTADLDPIGYFTLFISFDCYFLLHEISGLHLHHYGYDFYVNSTRYCGWKASSSLLPRSTHDLSYISKLYPFRVFGLLQFPDGPPQTKGWKSFQDLCRGFNDFCTYISKLYNFRVFGLLQFSDGPAQAKGWKSFQDLCRGFNDFCTGNSPLRYST